MAENPNKQTPATLNQIETTTPSIPRSFSILSGMLGGTFNAGHYRTIALKEVMADERIAVEGAKLFIQLQTPKTPAYQRLSAVVDVYHVPHIRVMKNYADFAAQSNPANKVQDLPNFGGKTFPYKNNGVIAISLQETTAWRDNVYSAYIPRVGAGAPIDTVQDENPFNMAPPINALACRGWTAIWNDMLRNKEFDEPREEYNGDTVSTQEWDSYMWNGSLTTADFYTGRARRNNSYYTNYRTQLQGYETLNIDDIGAEYDQTNFALNWASFESQFNEVRKQAENAQKNTWDVMQEIKGAKKLTQGRVQHIARRTFPINYSAITQNAYNNNEAIEDKFRVMGFQGGFSYTEIDLAFINNVEIIEDGYLHVVMTVTAETVFESGIERQFLNNNWKDRYRPDLKDDKLDVLYECEYGTPYFQNTENENAYTKTIGFKRRYNEYFKLPNMLNGEVYNRGYYQTNAGGYIDMEEQNRIVPNNTYQFFEFAGNKFQTTDLRILDKKIWLDYTDIMLNKNLAIQQPGNTNNEGTTLLQGPNQIVYFGEHYCVTDMPIDEAIKDNYTKWGEH